jgi:hypothetical protein
MTHTADKLPRFARDLLGSCPSAGTGVHAWLFRCARVLHAFYPAKDELIELLKAAAAGCGRDIPQREIAEAVRDSENCAWQPGAGDHTSIKPQPRWPNPIPDRIAAITKDGPGLVDLWELSPYRIEDNSSRTEPIIDQLFPGNPLLCVGKSVEEFNTKPREEWRGTLATYALIVPNPMSAVWGKTKDGSKESKHTLDNTGPRRFLVVEFDQGGADEHAAILIHLAAMAPLVLALHSGGKSIHGWFFCQGQPEDKLHAFMRYAVTLGADPKGWTRSQFMRMPDGTRDNGKRQTVYFFNPSVIKQ